MKYGLLIIMALILGACTHQPQTTEEIIVASNGPGLYEDEC